MKYLLISTCLLVASALAAPGPATSATRAGRGNWPPLAFSYPDGVALARDGSLYVVDTDENAVKKVSSSGEVTTVLHAGLRYPTGVALAPDGTLYVADAGSRAVWRLPPGSAIPDKLTGRGLVYPSAVAVAPDGALYVADAGGSTLGSVQRIVPGGRAELLATGLHRPTGVALAPDGTLYVAESTTSRVLRITPAGTTSLAVPAGILDQPHGLALAPDGTLYVADTYHHRVLSVSPTGQLATLADGFRYPSGLAADVAGNVYVTDTGHGLLKRIPLASPASALASPDLRASTLAGPAPMAPAQP